MGCNLQKQENRLHSMAAYHVREAIDCLQTECESFRRDFRNGFCSSLPNRWIAKRIAGIARWKNAFATTLSFCWQVSNFQTRLKVKICCFFFFYFQCVLTHTPASQLPTHDKTYTQILQTDREVRRIRNHIYLLVCSAAARHSSPGNILTAHTKPLLLNTE